MNGFFQLQGRRLHLQFKVLLAGPYCRPFQGIDRLPQRLGRLFPLQILFRLLRNSGQFLEGAAVLRQKFLTK